MQYINRVNNRNHVVISIDAESCCFKTVTASYSITISASNCDSDNVPPLRTQPGRVSAPADNGSSTATRDSFKIISIILFINKSQNSKAEVKAY